MLRLQVRGYCLRCSFGGFGWFAVKVYAWLLMDQYQGCRPLLGTLKCAMVRETYGYLVVPCRLMDNSSYLSAV